MEFIRLLYASCCSELFGQLKFRLVNRPPCRSISSSLHHFEMLLLLCLVLFLVWGIQTLTTMIDSCKRVIQDLATSTPEHFLLFAHYETVYNPYTWNSSVDHCQILHEFHTHVRSILQSSSCIVLPSQIHTCHQKLIWHPQYCPQYHVQLQLLITCTN